MFRPSSPATAAIVTAVSVLLVLARCTVVVGQFGSSPTTTTTTTSSTSTTTTTTTTTSTTTSSTSTTITTTSTTTTTTTTTSGTTLPDIGCFVGGECLGSAFVDLTFATNAETCLQFCQQTEGCNFFTHYFDDGECLALVNCATFSQDTCFDCTSGDATCTVPESDCLQPGRCLGVIVDNVHGLENQEECTQACRDEPGCGWASFDLNPEDDGFCTLTEDCPEVDVDCNTCTHAPVDCVNGVSSELLFVVGGRGADGSDVLDTEVVDLSGGGDNCLGAEPYPLINNLYPVAVLTPDGSPMVCGGEAEGDACLILDLNEGFWFFGPAMRQSRANHFAVKLDSDTYFILGGADDERTELYVDGEFIDGPDLELNVDWPCAVALDSENVVVTGGRSRENFTDVSLAYILNVFSGDVLRLHNMEHPRSGHACGLARESNRDPRVVVLGGVRPGELDDDDVDNEFYGEYLSLFDASDNPDNLAENEWTLQQAPRSVRFAGSVDWDRTENTMYALGGTDAAFGLVYNDAVEYSVTESEFVDKDGVSMIIPRYGFASVVLDRQDDRICG